MVAVLIVVVVSDVVVVVVVVLVVIPGMVMVWCGSQVLRCQEKKRVNGEVGTGRNNVEPSLG